MSKVDASDTIQHSNDTERTTNNLAWTKIKYSTASGFPDKTEYNLRVYQELRSESTSGTAYSDLRKNNSPLGVTHSTVSNVYVAYNDDVHVHLDPADAIELCAHVSDVAYAAYLRNFRLRGTVTQHLRAYDKPVDMVANA